MLLGHGETPNSCVRWIRSAIKSAATTLRQTVPGINRPAR
ncbi:hypothetical protein GJA_3683 [Janthinobacterium agaricidamnosum NBRC 102515 = DSM 9628]|uniref:Uncharacterized protein n=1 Tax=Janthinobacterium agaricidamnosum NBRC 102515 = DSM 9628 TaxID=1349767 RepID=W0VAB3_9BURK|nr:hypothetical protein GJA_3683 [Janthinobacterium agaricidamnosum NBRC 102515 = DSM 9628]